MATAGLHGQDAVQLLQRTRTCSGAPDRARPAYCGRCAWPQAPSFVVGVCGAIMTMPGLPRHPAAEGVSLNSDGEIEGLY